MNLSRLWVITSNGLWMLFGSYRALTQQASAGKPAMVSIWPTPMWRELVLAYYNYFVDHRGLTAMLKHVKKHSVVIYLHIWMWSHANLGLCSPVIGCYRLIFSVNPNPSSIYPGCPSILWILWWFPKIRVAHKVIRSMILMFGVSLIYHHKQS